MTAHPSDDRGREEEDRATLSVLFANYNHAAFLPEALEAIVSQSRPADEIIVIDDASTDDSLTVLEDYAELYPSITLLRNETNQGILANLVRLLDLARGDYVVGCAADDRVLPGFFERSMEVLDRFPEAGLCSAMSVVTDEDGGIRYVTPDRVVDEATYLHPAAVQTLMRRRGTWLEGNTIVYSRTRLIDAGGFRPELHAFTDSFAAQAVALRHGACFIPEPLAMWRRMDEGYSGQLFADFRAHRTAVATARRLMETEYRDAFPATYVRRWERDHGFQAAVNGYRRWLRGEAVGSTTTFIDLASGPATAVIDRIVRGAFRLGDLLGRLALLIRYRPWFEVRRMLGSRRSRRGRRFAAAEAEIAKRTQMRNR